ncbi:MAG: biotin/lipoate A/B protein ligase family protein [Desulfotomaculaceae bacterium]|nr:biotin/lipoate A/B protein ligase family protein [Desulfotomaculaceae bacterium]
MVQRWRLIKSGPGEPAWNMAVDEALVTCHSRGDSLPVLRLYTWSPPALSLGYFQKMSGIRLDLLDRLGIVPVRRSTGGRAVLHSGDLTYSLVASSDQDIPLGLVDSYRYLCKGLLATFASLGIKAGLGSEKLRKPFPASCFAVALPGDITWQGRKFVGSAQKRFGSSILQHGSILLRSQQKILNEIFTDKEKTNSQALLEKITCLDDILERQMELEEISDALANGFKKALNIEFQPDELNCEEEALATSLVGKYGELNGHLLGTKSKNYRPFVNDR